MLNLYFSTVLLWVHFKLLSFNALIFLLAQLFDTLHNLNTNMKLLKKLWGEKYHFDKF